MVQNWRYRIAENGNEGIVGLKEDPLVGKRIYVEGLLFEITNIEFDLLTLGDLTEWSLALPINIF